MGSCSVIAADTGESDQHPWLRTDGPGYSMSTGYHTTQWHPFVDGVFVPAAVGVDTLLDSSGNRVDLPESTGRTWGPIWSRRQADFWRQLATHVRRCRHRGHAVAAERWDDNRAQQR